MNQILIVTTTTSTCTIKNDPTLVSRLTLAIQWKTDFCCKESWSGQHCCYGSSPRSENIISERTTTAIPRESSSRIWGLCCHEIAFLLSSYVSPDIWPFSGLYLILMDGSAGIN